MLKNMQYLAFERLDYPKVLQSGVFCLVHRAARLAQQVLLEAMAAGCIPVVVADGLIMPFQQVE